MKKRIGFILLGTFLISACHTPPEFVKVEKSIIESEYMVKTPPVTVYLPADYERSDTYYPVLYAHDGQNLFDEEQSFGAEWQLDETLTRLTAEGIIGDVIVVAVHNTPRRTDDYTPSRVSNEWINDQGGDLSAYGKFLTEELMPYINSTYRTLIGPDNTVVMGSSLGGIASFYLIGWYPEIFGGAGVISPSFWWGDVQVTNDLLSMDFAPGAKIYIDGGYNEGDDETTMAQQMRTVYSALKEKGLTDFTNLYYYEDPDGTHNEVTWAKRLHMPLTFLFGDPDFTASEIEEVTVSPVEIGPDDQSKVAAHLRFTNDMLFTVFESGFDTLNGFAAVSNGTLIGIEQGTEVISYSNGELSADKTVEILPLSRQYSLVHIIVTSPEPVEELTLHVYMENGTNTNYIISATMKNETTGVAELIRNTGEGFRFTVKDELFRTALKEGGRELKKNFIFSPTGDTEIEIAGWE